MSKSYEPEVHYAAQRLAAEMVKAGVATVTAYQDVVDANEAIDEHMAAAGLSPDDLDAVGLVCGLADALVADESLVCGVRMVEAECLTCGERFHPNGDEDVQVASDGSVVLRHYLRGEEQVECGGFGPVVGAWVAR